jgi:hypothetical protein
MEIKPASPRIQEVVKGLQALRGIAQILAVTITAELGNILYRDRSRNQHFTLSISYLRRRSAA